MENEQKYITGEKFQKSTNFLLPLTGITNSGIGPKCSYLYWDGDENIDNFNLIVFYKTENDENFKSFEREHILKLERLTNCYNVKGGVIYIFTLIDFVDDVYAFMKGKYSQFQPSTKDILMKFFGGYGDDTVRPERPMHMALYPEKYFFLVARELNMPTDILREAGELCQPFNLKDETAQFDIIEERCCNKKELIT